MRRVVVIGAGPAGLTAAAAAAEAGATVTLLERNERPARKLMITGKGRCNVTNNTAALEELIANVPVNGRFLFSAFSRWMPTDTMEFFERCGVPLKVERGRRVFPVSDTTADIVDALVKNARQFGVGILRSRATKLWIEDGRLSGVTAEDGAVHPADAVIIASGGVSYPQTGSTGDGYRLARQAGHTVIPPKPSLIPLECHEGFCAQLTGLSLRNAALDVVDADTGRTVYRDFGELLFTHFGVSGPMALSASAHLRDMQPERYRLELNLKPALSPEQLDARLLRDFAANAGRNFLHALDGLLPKAMVPVIAKLSGIPPGLRTNQVTREQRQGLAALLQRFPMTVTGFRPIEEAIVTSGGVNVAEVRPGTMESKRLPGLYFAGEVLDVDAYTGGYNLQIAFSTGRLAGLEAAKSSSQNK
ncbi:MAG: NAD(P)/FAD-dependent oxidoreductase [Oscillospiraceae bacterium]|jgi:predicted Rossmann fold flavoprotein|nr:NAD(P)/FAD-dependent oxidoreductase [Oscillospiraceae bacterium]